MAKLADALDLGSSSERSAGSIPVSPIGRSSTFLREADNLLVQARFFDGRIHGHRVFGAKVFEGRLPDHAHA